MATEQCTAAMRSPINWALLGLVIQRASYGYELVQRFERTYGDALELSSPSQIYTALDALARRSLVEEVPASGSADGVVRQPKPHYRATQQGMRDYQQWLIAQVHDERRRSRLFAQQLAVLAPQDALTVIERYEQACLTQASSTPIANGAGDSPACALCAPKGYQGDGAGALVDRLVCEENRLAIGARLAWIDYARRELAVLAPARNPKP